MRATPPATLGFFILMGAATLFAVALSPLSAPNAHADEIYPLIFDRPSRSDRVSERKNRNRHELEQRVLNARQGAQERQSAVSARMFVRDARQTRIERQASYRSAIQAQRSRRQSEQLGKIEVRRRSPASVNPRWDR